MPIKDFAEGFGSVHKKIFGTSLTLESARDYDEGVQELTFEHVGYGIPATNEE